jgi:transcriptional regulator with XRE-family HTH domain
MKESVARIKFSDWKVGKNLQDVRLSKNITPEVLAQMIGDIPGFGTVSPHDIVNYESGKKRIEILLLRKWTEVLKLGSITYVFQKGSDLGSIANDDAQKK